MFRMVSVAILFGCKDRVSIVERVLGVTDGLPLLGILVSVCATVLLLAASVGLFVPDGLYWCSCSCWHYPIDGAKRHRDCHLHT